MKTALIIPALNEEEALPAMLAGLPDWLDQVIVVDNGSTDATAAVAQAGGATILREEQPGYGHACLAGIDHAGDADILIFMDADGSDDPQSLAALIAPIRDGQADFVLADRTALSEPGALTPVQRFGNALSCFLIRLIWGHRYRDLGPMRAIRRPSLLRLNLDAGRYGWTIQMQIRALKAGLRVAEIASRYRPRQGGYSKVSGTLIGSVRAGAGILKAVAREWLTRT